MLETAPYEVASRFPRNWRPTPTPQRQRSPAFPKMQETDQNFCYICYSPPAEEEALVPRRSRRKTYRDEEEADGLTGGWDGRVGGRGGHDTANNLCVMDGRRTRRRRRATGMHCARHLRPMHRGY